MPTTSPHLFYFIGKKRGGCVIISDKVQFSNLHSYEKQLRPFRHPDHFGENDHTFSCVLCVLCVLFLTNTRRPRKITRSLLSSFVPV